MSDKPAQVKSLVEGVQSIFDGSVDMGEGNHF
jgi:hypothetical protein